MKTGAIIQARINSKRLPGKIFLKLPYKSNYTVLEQIITRIRKVEKIDYIIIATTDNILDNKVEEFCKEKNIDCFRGNEEDVLSRFYLAAKKYNLDIIIRLTGDSPCIDYQILNTTIETHLQNENDFTKTKNYPLGTILEIISFPTLEKTYQQAKQSFEKEHVTPYIYQTNPDIFKIEYIKAKDKLHAPDLRLTLDTIEDYDFLCMIFDELFLKNNYFGIKDVLSLLNHKPWLKRVNNKIIQKKTYLGEKEQIKEAIKLLEFQELKTPIQILKKYLNENIHNNRRK